MMIASTGVMWPQEESSVVIRNPFTAPMDRELGSRIFLRQCASCHGRDGRGGQGTPDLTTGNFRRASSDEGLYQVVAKGVPGTTMPAFALAGRDIWQVLTYIRSLSAGRTHELVKGNAQAGAALFNAQGCRRCHGHGSEGGTMGPDLTAIGAERTIAEIRKAIEDPQADVASDYWRLRAVTKGGETVTGRRLNEDTYTVQCLDSQGRLRSLVKAELTEYQVIRPSMMPAYRVAGENGKLTEAQMDDLLAFLVGAKGGTR